MSKKIILSGLIISIIVSLFVLLPQVAARTIIPDEVTIDEASRQRVLNATIKISFFAPAYDENGQPQVTVVNGQRQTVYKGGTGLGTVVWNGSEPIIVTHDHWKLLENPEAVAEFATADGQLLLSINAPEFAQLIRYRDGGTMILDLPSALDGHFQPGVTGEIETLDRNDVLLIAYRQHDAADSIGVEAVVVTKDTEYEGLPALELVTVSGKTVAAGNSGGGVWSDGRLVANMWSTILEQVKDTGEMLETTQSRAALLTVNG
jgi:hypothetical protein